MQLCGVSRIYSIEKIVSKKSSYINESKLIITPISYVKPIVEDILFLY